MLIGVLVNGRLGIHGSICRINRNRVKIQIRKLLLATTHANTGHLAARTRSYVLKTTGTVLDVHFPTVTPETESKGSLRLVGLSIDVVGYILALFVMQLAELAFENLQQQSSI